MKLRHFRILVARYNTAIEGSEFLTPIAMPETWAEAIANVDSALRWRADVLSGGFYHGAHGSDIAATIGSVVDSYRERAPVKS